MPIGRRDGVGDSSTSASGSTEGWDGIRGHEAHQGGNEIERCGVIITDGMSDGTDAVRGVGSTDPGLASLGQNHRVRSVEIGFVRVSCGFLA